MAVCWFWFSNNYKKLCTHRLSLSHLFSHNCRLVMIVFVYLKPEAFLVGHFLKHVSKHKFVDGHASWFWFEDRHNTPKRMLSTPVLHLAYRHPCLRIFQTFHFQYRSNPQPTLSHPARALAKMISGIIDSILLTDSLIYNGSFFYRGFHIHGDSGFCVS